MYLASTIILIISVVAIFDPTLAGLCRFSNDHKNYTCNGFRFREMSAGRNNRLQIRRADLRDCKETEIKEEGLNFPNVEVLIVSCDIERIHANGFKNLRGLKELDLGNNSISELTKSVFQHSEGLKMLNLSHNHLEELPRPVFIGLPNLKRLFLSNNLISKFDIKAMDPLRGLEELSLRDNRIEVVPARLFRKLSKLRVVDLSKNQIEDLGSVFLNSYNVQRLNFSKNAIKELPPQIFQQMNNLKVLDLSNNRLSVIHESALRLSSLEELFLQDNQISLFEVKGVGFNRIPLRYLDIRFNRLVFLEEGFIKVARYLVDFEFVGNPWQCDCYDKIVAARAELSLDVRSLSSDEKDFPTCVLGPEDSRGCRIDKDKLEIYYKLFKEQLDL